MDPPVGLCRQPGCDACDRPVAHSFVANDWRGYLEDRRPNSQGDPYRIAGRIIETIATVDEPAAEDGPELTLVRTG